MTLDPQIIGLLEDVDDLFSVIESVHFAEPNEPTLWAGIDIPVSIGESIALSGYEKPQDMHLTLAYMGKQSELDGVDADAILRHLDSVSSEFAPFKATIQGFGRFSASDSSDGKDVIYASVNAPGLVALRQAIAKALSESGASPRTDHDFVPHITLAYVDTDEPTPINRLSGGTFTVDRFNIDVFGTRYAFMLKADAVRYFSSSVNWWDRNLTTSEQRVNFAEIEHNLGHVIDTHKSAMNAEWVKMIRSVNSEVIDWIEKPGLTPRQKLVGIRHLTLGTEDFEKQLVEVGLDSRKIGTVTAVAELRKAGLHPTTEAERFDAGIAPDNPFLLGNFYGLLEARSFRIASGMEQKVLAAIQQTLENAYSNGLTVSEQRERFEALMVSLEEGHLISPGRVDGYDYKSEAIQETTVRTIANEGFNGARHDLYKRNDDFVLGYQISEVANGLDYSKDGSLRSHPLSQHLDNLVVPMGSRWYNEFAGPQAFNDRKVDVAWTVLDEDLKASTEEELQRAYEWKVKLSPRFV